jgi:hypothetical protein
MTELKLHKYIQDNNIEWHRHDNDGEKDIIIFPYFHQIEEFREIASADLFDDDGLECRMKDGYFAIWMNQVCEYYGIEINNVFVGDDWH